MMANLRPFPALPVVLALAAAIPVAACSTEEVYPKVTPYPSDPYSAVGIEVYMIRDDFLTQDSPPAYRSLPPYGVTVDGIAASQDGIHPLIASPNISVGVLVQPGTHAIALVDGQGHVAAVSPPLEAKLGVRTVVAFFGGPTSLRARVLLDDPATVPAGSTHVRVLNALADHQPIQIVQCPTALDGRVPYTASACTPLGDPVAHGDVFETDTGADVANRLGFYWAAPGAGDAVVSDVSIYATTGGFVTRIPIQVQGPAGTCPSCIVLQF